MALHSIHAVNVSGVPNLRHTPARTSESGFALAAKVTITLHVDTSSEVDITVTEAVFRTIIEDGAELLAKVARESKDVAAPEVIDPEGCGCTDCLTGYSRPAQPGEVATR